MLILSKPASLHPEALLMREHTWEQGDSPDSFICRRCMLVK